MNNKKALVKQLLKNSYISTKEKVRNYRVYNLNRLKVMRFTRLISTNINSLNIFIKFKRWLKYKGILPENSYTTFF